MIYIVTAGNYDDYRIEAVFTDKAKADDYANKFNIGIKYRRDRAYVEEWEVTD